MKRLLLIISFTIFILNANAQSWCPKGATWYASAYSGVFGYDGMTEFKYTKDTLIQNKACKVISGAFNGKSYTYFGTGSYTYVPNFRTYYTYENNGTVCLFSNNSFDTVVNFKAQIGDKWRRLHCPSDTTVITYTVVDTGHVVINNLTLRTVRVTYSIVNYPITCLFIERILGGPLYWQDLFGMTCLLKGAGGDDYASPMYCGYSDDTFSDFNSTTGACRFTGIQENHTNNSDIHIYPNPTAGSLTLEIEKSSFIYIVNSLGSKIYENYFEQTGPQKIDMEGLSAGVYYLKVKTATGNSYQKIIRE